ncbi:hypothetical protein LTR10_010323 [Elasticomyces elasticus]|nr:hypothetical protein LTR10_010323 [Elasticomyces elasticus]KAK4972227.1 hypothetical protein LTR42_006733 [Elasticomyces elasticus]
MSLSITSYTGIPSGLLLDFRLDLRLDGRITNCLRTISWNNGHRAGKHYLLAPEELTHSFYRQIIDREVFEARHESKIFKSGCKQ